MNFNFPYDLLDTVADKDYVIWDESEKQELFVQSLYRINVSSYANLKPKDCFYDIFICIEHHRYAFAKKRFVASCLTFSNHNTKYIVIAKTNWYKLDKESSSGIWHHPLKRIVHDAMIAKVKLLADRTTQYF